MYFGYDKRQRNSLNLNQTLIKEYKEINLWKWRGLLERIWIVKTFSILKLKELIKEQIQSFTILYGMGKIK